MARSLLAIFEIVFVCTLWGFGFTAARWCLASIDPYWLTASRFLIAFIGGLLCFVFLPKSKQGFRWKDLWWTFLPGVFLGAGILFQTKGLQTTSVTNSGFLTCLYVVMVPLLEVTFFGKRIHKRHIFFIFIALLGTSILVGFHLNRIRAGDFLTILCAFMFSLQIVAIERTAQRVSSDWVYNTYQSLWAALIALYVATPFSLFAHRAAWGARFWSGIAALSLGSTLLGFWLQVRAQKKIPAAQASLLFLLESPFAAFFSMVFLGERLDLWRALGALLILAACALSVIFGAKR